MNQAAACARYRIVYNDGRRNKPYQWPQLLAHVRQDRRW
jgi:hypothetical protein